MNTTREDSRELLHSHPVLGPEGRHVEFFFGQAPTLQKVPKIAEILEKPGTQRKTGGEHVLNLTGCLLF